MLAQGIGASVARKEDDRFLRGRGQYVADFKIPGTRDVAFVRSPVAHARIRAVYIPEQYRGAVFTSEHLTGVKPIVSAPPLKGFKRSEQPILAHGKVRYVGELVAMCVGSSRAEAEDIAASVSLDLEELPAVADMLAALQPNAPLVHEEWGDNIFIEFSEDGPIDRIAAEAPVKVTRTIRTSRHCMFPMEGRGVIAYRDSRLRYLTLVTSTQFPHSVQTGLCECLGLEDGSVRIISPDVGGGFGYKGLLAREEVALGWLAMQVSHPVRWLEDCREHLTANGNCREHYYKIDGYATQDGKLLAIDCVGYVDAGAYSEYPISSAPEAAQIANLLPGPYDFSVYRCRSAAVATNKCGILPYRGVARSGVCLAIEAVMDAIAREISAEPYEVRLRNMVRPEQMPFENVLGKHFDSGNHPECLRRAVEAIRLHEVRARQRRREPDGRLVGVGLSFFVEQAAHGTSVLAAWGRPIVPGYEQANVRLTADGDIEIRVGTHSHGQGHETVYAQMASEWLGVPFENIRFVQGDTDAVPIGRGTYGSRSMQIGGNALKRAADSIIEKAKPMAAMMLEAAAGDIEFKDGAFRIVGTDRALPLTAVAKAFYRPAMLPPQFDVGLEASGTFAAEPPNYPNGCHLCEVEIDPETGQVTLARYAAVDDVGRVMNRLLCEGQVHGGVGQGVGQALMEAIVFDAEGQLVTGSFQDYAMPRAEDFPDLVSEIAEVPATTNPLGVKGAGEAGATGAPPAVISAILDALKPLGIDHIDMPATPSRVWAAINAAKPRAAAE